MQIQQANRQNICFQAQIPKPIRDDIKDLTVNYLKRTEGYSGRALSCFNLGASTFRTAFGTLATSSIIYELPKLIHNEYTLAYQVLTGVGSLFVGLSRLETSKKLAKTLTVSKKLNEFTQEMIKNGFSKPDELIYGIKEYMNRTGVNYSFLNRKAKKVFSKVQQDLSSKA